MRAFPLLALVLALSFSLAACSVSVPRLAAPPQTSSLRAVPPDGIVTVRPGDNVYLIAQRYGVSPRAVIDTNGLRPPYLLRPGDRLRLPQALVHVVRAGDTVSEIAEHYGVSMRSLVVLNGLGPPYLIRVGDRLRLPPVSDAPVSVAARTPRPVPQPPTRQAGAASHERTANRPWSGGGQLHFPVTRDGQPAQPVPVPVPRPASEQQATGTSAPPRATPAPPSRPSRTVALTPPAKTGRGFAWPLQGRIISGFGPREGGLHNDGINILAAEGTDIRAAENGIVIYAGNELRGYGNLLLVKHTGGYTTAYAHAARLLVGRGDRVQRGQVIATVGRTGNVSRPQLHFEIRKGPRPVDPRKELPAAQLSSLN
jgi:murein DD-endopeptidase MepM/ murein hydrolase activator NlpD